MPNINTSTLEHRSPTDEQKGARLGNILDHLGFPGGRGRVAEFHRFLMQSMPETFSDLKYTTVRGWFRDNCPKSSMMEDILFILEKTYGDVGNIKLAKAWWRLGGKCPLEIEQLSSGIVMKSNEPDMKSAERFLEMIEGVNSIYVAQVYLLIYQLAATMGINIASDILPEIAEEVFKKVMRYCKEKEPEVDDPRLKNLIISILRLAKEGLL